MVRFVAGFIATLIPVQLFLFAFVKTVCEEQKATEPLYLHYVGLWVYSAAFVMLMLQMANPEWFIRLVPH